MIGSKRSHAKHPQLGILEVLNYVDSYVPLHLEVTENFRHFRHQAFSFAFIEILQNR